MVDDDEILILQTLVVRHELQILVEQRDEEVHHEDDHDEEIDDQVVAGGVPEGKHQTVKVELSEKRLRQRGEDRLDGRVFWQLEEEEIGAGGKCREDDAGKQGEVEKVDAGVGQCCTENGDAPVVAQKVKHLTLRDERDESDADEIQIVKFHNRQKVDQFSCETRRKKDNKICITRKAQPNETLNRLSAGVLKQNK